LRLVAEQTDGELFLIAARTIRRSLDSGAPVEKRLSWGMTIFVLLLWFAMISPIVYFGWRVFGVAQ